MNIRKYRNSYLPSIRRKGFDFKDIFLIRQSYKASFALENIRKKNKIAYYYAFAAFAAWCASLSSMPFMKGADSCVEYFLAISIASLITTEWGMSVL